MAGIVFTGAPGSGKSTTIGRFEVDGQTVVKEVARELIESGLTPQDDFDLFHETLLETQIKRESAVSGQSVYFVDRGLHDIKAYYMLAGRSDRKELQRLLHGIYSDLELHVTVVPFAPFSRRIEWLRNKL